MKLDDFLADQNIAHFGVKGMHWGVRKSRGEPSEDHVRANDIRGKVKASGGIHALSNAELEELNKRLNLEGSYTKLTQNKSQVSDGEKFVKDNVGRVKLALDAVNTAQQLHKTVKDLT